MSVSFISHGFGSVTGTESKGFYSRFNRVKKGRICRASPLKCLAESFHDALELGFVQDYGRMVTLDSNGRFLSSSNLQTPLAHQEVLSDVSRYILSVLGIENTISVFVRGSIASGNPLLANTSDIDLVVFTKQTVPKSKVILLRNGICEITTKWLCIPYVDLRMETCDHGTKEGCNIDEALQIIVQQYSIPIYGSVDNLGLGTAARSPGVLSAMNIRRDERMFAEMLERGKKGGDVEYQLGAAQWLCKRCLRAITELACNKTLAHARDLVPCYKLGSEAFPEYTEVFLKALQFACASERNNYLNYEKQEALSQAASIAQDLTEVVEELFLQHTFADEMKHVPQRIAMAKSEVSSRYSIVSTLAKSFRKYMGSVSLHSRQPPTQLLCFASEPPPRLAIHGISEISEEILVVGKLGKTVSSSYLRKVDEPVVLRDVVSINKGNDILKELYRSFGGGNVDCRLSPTREVMFCRSEHNWIERGAFRPPSVARSIPFAEAIARMSTPCSAVPMYYKKNACEHIYIQTKVPASGQRYQLSEAMKMRIAQEERIWISTGGTVSTLHFDASYSALLQITGKKRMIFLPQECNQQLGIYPLGHPLHRRARVNLKRRDTVVFKEFWRSHASKAVEVTLEAGDLVLFPSFWCHYTESLASETEKLSVSHTLRYV